MLPEAWLLDGKALQCIPDPEENSYKNYYGHTVIMGGTRGYNGAAILLPLLPWQQDLALFPWCPLLFRRKDKKSVFQK